MLHDVAVVGNHVERHAGIGHTRSLGPLELTAGALDFMADPARASALVGLADFAGLFGRHLDAFRCEWFEFECGRYLGCGQ